MAAAKKTAAAKPDEGAFSADEKAAMKEAAKERRAQKAGKTDGLADVLSKIAAMDDPDRAIAEKVHALVLAAAPDLEVRTWYGMPAYAKDGKVVCFFQGADKFKTRYGTFGFQHEARLDDGAMWPVAFALTDVTADQEAAIVAMVQKAVG